MPQKMVVGAAAGFAGALFTMILLATSWDGTLDAVYVMGLDMLVAVSFFAVAGTFMKYSPVQGSTMPILSALAIAFSLIAAMYGAVEIWQGIVLVILGIVALLCAACPAVTSWVDVNRKA